MPPVRHEPIDEVASDESGRPDHDRPAIPRQESAEYVVICRRITDSRGSPASTVR